MAILFSFYNFSGLVDLHRGIVDRLSDDRAEAFSILYCDFAELNQSNIEDSLEEVLRCCDAYVHNDNHYFFILYQTDKFGAEVVAKMFEDFFDKTIKHDVVSFPKDGESSQDLFDSLQTSVKKNLDIEIECLDHSTRQRTKN